MLSVMDAKAAGAELGVPAVHVAELSRLIKLLSVQSSQVTTLERDLLIAKATAAAATSDAEDAAKRIRVADQRVVEFGERVASAQAAFASAKSDAELALERNALLAREAADARAAEVSARERRRGANQA